MGHHCEDLIDRKRATIRNYETNENRGGTYKLPLFALLTPFPLERLFFSRFSAQNHPRAPSRPHPPARGSSPFRTAERAQRAQMENGLINRSNYRSATPLIRYPTPGHPSRPPEGSPIRDTGRWREGIRGLTRERRRREPEGGEQRVNEIVTRGRPMSPNHRRGTTRISGSPDAFAASRRSSTVTLLVGRLVIDY